MNQSLNRNILDLPEPSLRRAGPDELDPAAVSPWPFNTMDATPLAWWRLLPADQFRDAEYLVMRATLDRLIVMNGDHRWRDALRGDAAAAVGIAIALVPIETVTLRTDIVMTAVVCAALADDPAASLVMSYVLQHAFLDHPFGSDLAQSWRGSDARFAVRHRMRERKSAAGPQQGATNDPSIISGPGDMA